MEKPKMNENMPPVAQEAKGGNEREAILEETALVGVLRGIMDGIYTPEPYLSGREVRVSVRGSSGELLYDSDLKDYVGMWADAGCSLDSEHIKNLQRAAKSAER